MVEANCCNVASGTSPNKVIQKSPRRFTSTAWRRYCPRLPCACSSPPARRIPRWSRVRRKTPPDRPEWAAVRARSHAIGRRSSRILRNPATFGVSCQPCASMSTGWTGGRTTVHPTVYECRSTIGALSIGPPMRTCENHNSLEHLSVGIERLRAQQQAGFRVGPQLVGESIRIFGIELQHLGIDARDAVVAQKLRFVDARGPDRRSSSSKAGNESRFCRCSTTQQMPLGNEREHARRRGAASCAARRRDFRAIRIHRRRASRHA